MTATLFNVPAAKTHIQMEDLVDRVNDLLNDDPTIQGACKQFCLQEIGRTEPLVGDNLQLDDPIYWNMVSVFFMKLLLECATSQWPVRKIAYSETTQSG